MQAPTYTCVICGQPVDPAAGDVHHACAAQALDRRYVQRELAARLPQPVLESIDVDVSAVFGICPWGVVGMIVLHGPAPKAVFNAHADRLANWREAVAWGLWIGGPAPR